MKNLVIVVLAFVLALVGEGCANPVQPQFSPDGHTLVFERKSKLILRGDGRDRVLSEAKPQAVAWSPDGSYLAYTTGSESSIKLRGGGTRKLHEQTHIYSTKSRETVIARDVGSPVAWLNGDLLVTDQRKPEPMLDLLDASSGQVRATSQPPGNPLDMSESESRREVYIRFHSGDPWQSFDGVRFVIMTGTESYAALSTSGWETIFLDQNPEIEARNFKLYRWNGETVNRVATIDVAKVLREQRGIGIGARIESVTDDGQRVALLVDVIHCTPEARADLERITQRYGWKAVMNGKLPKSVARRMDREFKHASSSECVYVWSAGEGFRRIESIRSRAEEHIQLAFDSPGHQLAIITASATHVVGLK